MTCLTSVVVIMCAVGTVTSSLESRILTFVDGAIRRAETIELAEGVRLVNTSAESPRTLQGDFGTLLADRVRSFFQNHAIRVDLSGTDVRSGVRAISDFAEAVVEPRGKKNKMKKMKKTKDYILPLLLGMKAKMALLSAMMGNMIAIIAGKALLLGKIALILGAMLFLKKLAVSPPKDVVYYKHKKVVPTAHDKLDWGGRTDSFPQPPIAAAQEMAYAGQKQTPQS
ncbi:UNVERIFIED_CONTAM: hypothetical protein PYX00_004768 [Menopon gallinae]|uniref:Uncharacterized protein n=1 Tax=Menopon gallinae TaxID=328185 RepID=A0AAW2I5Y9_9NEOP